jgi:hypothetical protein
MLTVPLLVKKFPILCGTWKFITVFTTACHLVLSFTELIQSKPPHPIYLSPISVLSSNLHHFHGVSFLHVDSPKPSTQCSSTANMLHAQPNLILFILITQAIHMWQGQQSWSQYGNFREEKNLLPLMGIKPWHTQPAAWPLYLAPWFQYSCITSNFILPFAYVPLKFSGIISSNTMQF